MTFLEKLNQHCVGGKRREGISKVCCLRHHRQDKGAKLGGNPKPGEELREVGNDMEYISK